MERVNPRELRTAARVADALVYAAGIAGVVAGALLFEAGQAGFAVVAWSLTFVAGAALRLAAAAARALAELLVRSRAIEDDIAAMRGAQTGLRDSEEAADPYRRWGGHR